MGTWDTAIKGNDTFLDIYQNFFDRYNEGSQPAEISKNIIVEFTDYFNDIDDRNNSLFALALAQWETKSLDSELFKTVKEIIDSGQDVEVWKNLGADEKTINKRKLVLEKFLKEISVERPKAKRRVRPKFEYKSVELLKITAPDGQKRFEVIESYVNGKYSNTASAISWNSGGGGGVFHFIDQGKMIKAKWIDSQTLEIIHDSEIKFNQKNEIFFYCGDQGDIIYVPDGHN